MPARSLYDYVPHHRTKEKLDHVARPVKVSEQLPHGNAVARFNSWFAVKVTNGVGTMWCAYLRRPGARQPSRGRGSDGSELSRRCRRPRPSRVEAQGARHLIEAR